MQKEKYEIIKHQLNFIDFVDSLKGVNEGILRSPISEGKWSVLEIISHFSSWDEFVIEKRIPYFFSMHSFLKGPNSETLNEQTIARKRDEKIEVIFGEFLKNRSDLVLKMKEIPDDLWLVEFKIGQFNLNVYKYFKGLMEHDIHHMEQIKRAVDNV